MIYCDLSCSHRYPSWSMVYWIILEVTVLLIHGYHRIPQSHVVLLAVSCYLAQTHHCYDRILISCVGTCQAAVALFQAKYVVVAAGLLEELDLLANELEAGQYLDQLYAVSLRNRFGHVGGNDGSYQCADSRAWYRSQSSRSRYILRSACRTYYR